MFNKHEEETTTLDSEEGKRIIAYCNIIRDNAIAMPKAEDGPKSEAVKISVPTELSSNGFLTVNSDSYADNQILDFVGSVSSYFVKVFILYQISCASFTKKTTICKPTRR